MLKKILLGLLVILVLIQFYRPAKNIAIETPKTDFLAVTNPTNNTAKLIRDACYDCHSNNTKYPWYNNIAPVSWVIAHHVDEGKEHLNYSEWSTFSVKKKNHKLEEMIEMLEEREMPLESYLPMHPEAKLSNEQITELNAWFKTLIE